MEGAGSNQHPERLPRPAARLDGSPAFRIGATHLAVRSPTPLITPNIAACRLSAQGACPTRRVYLRLRAMNIDEMASRLKHTIQSFADISGSARATLCSWRADSEKYYAANARPETLERMAASLDDYVLKVKQVAKELRAEASERRAKRG